MEKMTAKLGAILYVCWGLLHLTAAYGVYKLAQNSPAGLVQGRLMQTAFFLLAFAVTTIALAVTLNWRNDRLGFWANVVIGSIIDIPFILFVLIPGYAPWWPGILGPALWIGAVSFTGHARMSARQPVTLRPGSVSLGS